MKRSEAVSNIQELIEGNLESLTMLGDASLVAELILHHLEQKGMLPPPAEVKTTQTEYDVSKKLERQVEVVIQRNMWEDEDGI